MDFLGLDYFFGTVQPEYIEVIIETSQIFI